MPDSDHYRVRVASSKPQRLLRALRDAQVDGSERDVLGRVAVTHEEEVIFLYTDSYEAALHARELAQELMDERAIEGTLTIWRWHPLEEHWEDAKRPLPSTEGERAAEHARLIAEEDAESWRAGYPEWEVRVTLPTHQEASALARTLQEEGLAVQRHWRHLLVGAEDEDRAQELVQRLRSEAPPGGEVHAEGVGKPIWEAMHPFAIFGGIAN